ncbi:MAG: hypothetical protein NTV05_04635 [Acidobacteria bacterium]|nr:hypothetical protein [Acidobacteriota bacterium]
MSLSRWWRERRFERSYRMGIRRDLERIGATFKPTFKTASTGNDFDAAMTSYLAQCRLPDLRLETIVSRRLRRRAERFGIDPPRDWWIHDEEFDLWYLTPDGKRQLKRRVTQERIWTFKQWVHALTPVVALLAGLIGVIIGLIGIWRWR